jgi:hypothetical protein
VREPLSFDHKVELKLLNAKHTTYKLHSYLNEKNVGKYLLFNQSNVAEFSMILKKALVRSCVQYNIITGLDDQMEAFCTKVL